MNKEQLIKFFQENSPAIIVNTSTDRALICLEPEFEDLADGMLLMKFNSLNDAHGNSVTVKAIIPSEEANTLYFENDDENALMLQKLNLANYKHYIQPQYINAPEVSTEAELMEYIANL